MFQNVVNPLDLSQTNHSLNHNLIEQKAVNFNPIHIPFLISVQTDVVLSFDWTIIFVGSVVNSMPTPVCNSLTWICHIWIFRVKST